MSDGYEALQRILNESFDVILIDHFLPGVSGTKILSAAKKKDPRQVVVVMTNTNDKNVVHKIDALGGRYIGMPAAKNVIKSFIEDGLARMMN